METYAQTLPEVKAMNGNAAAQLRVDIEFLKRVLGCFFFVPSHFSASAFVSCKQQVQDDR